MASYYFNLNFFDFQGVFRFPKAADIWGSMQISYFARFPT